MRFGRAAERLKKHREQANKQQQKEWMRESCLRLAPFPHASRNSADNELAIFLGMPITDIVIMLLYYHMII